MATLTELLRSFTLIESTLAESGGELTPELELELTTLEKSLEQKVDHVAYICERAPAVAEFYKEKARKLQAMAKSLESVAERLKDMVRIGLSSTGRTELIGDEYTFVKQKERASVDIFDEEAIPIELCVMVYKPIKAAIKGLLENGTAVPGAQLLHKSPIVIKPSKKLT